MKIKVPNKVTKEIEKLCLDINPDYKPRYVVVDTKVTADGEEDCFVNVARKMMEDDGDFQFGWAIWEWPNVMLEAEFWAVWVNPDGEWVDITPRGRGDKLLFLPDDKTQMNGRSVDSVFTPIIDHPLIEQYLEINKQIWRINDELIAAGKGDMDVCEVLIPYIERKDALEKEIDVKLSGGVRRNDLCSCGSGKKFKKCCGH